MQGLPPDNSPLSGAIQVLNVLSEVGKALPFVAPAFIMLKVIIDVETRAQEVDLKCNDLLERVTFMVSHLPILEKIEVMPSTRKVIDRMNDVIKNAAALIAAYRKQNKIARRLSLTNRDKFTQCAESVNACCSNLLMSLQIHQSTQLESLILRAVPIDDEDVAARTFVETHGGSVDVVLHDRELVKEFAQQQHMVMDDSVMEQLNANISDSMQQNHQRLEGILKDNVSVAIADGLKSIVAELNAAEAEQKFVCVQCENQFTHYTNGPKACSFHQAEYDSWIKQYSCCSTNQPCQFNAHRSKHHCDYPYGNFFPRARAVTGYVDTHEEWAAVEDTNLETDAVQKASVGQLWLWVSRGARVQENTLLIIVGRVWYTYPYYFNTFTAKELEDISKSVRLSKRTLIFRTDKDDNEFAMAEWILSVSGKITGVKLTAKTATSTNPFVRVCPVDLLTCTKSGDILTISEGGMRSYTPATSYTLPQTLHYGPTLDDTATRPVRTNFKTRVSPSLRLIMKTLSEPPLSANPQFASTEVDFFTGKVSVFNNNPPSTTNPNPITVASVNAQYRFIGEEEYRPVQDFKLLNSSDLPVSVDPRQTWPIEFQVSVPRSEEDKKLHVKWWNRAFGARKRPLRVKLLLEDIEGEQASLVLEYVFKPYPLEKRGENDLGFFFFDEPNLLERCYLHVQKVEDSGSGVEAGVVKIAGNELKVKRLHQTVYKAIKTGKTEIDLEIGQEKNDGEWEWGAWALVDISCRRVYAFKIIVKQGKKIDEAKRRFGCMGYALCPEYGDVVQNGKTRPVCYATEVVRLTKLEEYVEEDLPQDDTVDDFKPPVPPKPVSPALNGIAASGSNGMHNAGMGAPGFNSIELNNRLASIDVNLARIADALELLVGASLSGTRR